MERVGCGKFRVCSDKVEPPVCGIYMSVRVVQVCEIVGMPEERVRFLTLRLTVG